MGEIISTNPHTSESTRTRLDFWFFIEINCWMNDRAVMVRLLSLMETQVKLTALKVGLFLWWGSSFNKLLAYKFSLLSPSPVVHKASFTLINFIITKWWDVVYSWVTCHSSLNVYKTELLWRLSLTSFNVLQYTSTLLLALATILIFCDWTVSWTWWGATSLLRWLEWTFSLFYLIFHFYDGVHVDELIFKHVHKRITEAGNNIRSSWIFVNFKFATCSDCNSHRCWLS